MRLPRLLPTVLPRSEAFLPATVIDYEPAVLPRAVLWTLVALLTAATTWAWLGRIDTVAVAEGRLVPRTQLKIIQPAEGGVLREILVAEGERVRAGQIVGRMDVSAAQADANTLQADLSLRRLQLRRIEAEIRGVKLVRDEHDPVAVYEQVEAQRDARVQAYENSLAEERAVIARARRDLQAAQETRAKLAASLPLVLEHEQAFERLAKEGFAGRLMSNQRLRERLELEQDLRAQEHRVESARATMEQAERRMAQLSANYRAQLRSERIEADRERSRLEQELGKLGYRQSLAELRAPVDGVVKDIATQTKGSVLAPGAVLMTVVPEGEALMAEVWLLNQDAGFVRAGQPAKLKLATFPFQRYGALEGSVVRVSADASERSGAEPGRGTLAYRALIAPAAQSLRSDGRDYDLLAGMQLTAEIRLADRTVLEYLLSPVQKIAAEAGRER